MEIQSAQWNLLESRASKIILSSQSRKIVVNPISSQGFCLKTIFSAPAARFHLCWFWTLVIQKIFENRLSSQSFSKMEEVPRVPKTPPPPLKTFIHKILETEALCNEPCEIQSAQNYPK